MGREKVREGKSMTEGSRWEREGEGEGAEEGI